MGRESMRLPLPFLLFSSRFVVALLFRSIFGVSSKFLEFVLMWKAMSIEHCD